MKISKQIEEIRKKMSNPPFVKRMKALIIVCLVIIVTFKAAIMVEEHMNQPCQHPTFAEFRINQSTCDINGTSHMMCNYCGYIGTVIKKAKLEHVLSEYQIVREPTYNRTGLETAHCENCDYVTSRNIICHHETTKELILKEVNCTDKGISNTVCEKCNLRINTTFVAPLGHNMGDWKIIKYASPEANGTKEKVCSRCDKAEYSYFEFQMGKNAIYISGTSINANVVPCAFTQSNCDRYDLIYTASYYGCGPWVIGHNYGTLGALPQTKVGAKIYLSIDGNIRTYQVAISEFGMQNDSWTDIIGQSSGLSIFANMGVETLRLYTCYGGTNGRWIVLAKRIS